MLIVTSTSISSFIRHSFNQAMEIILSYDNLDVAKFNTMRMYDPININLLQFLGLSSINGLPTSTYFKWSAPKVSHYTIEKKMKELN